LRAGGGGGRRCREQPSVVGADPIQQGMAGGIRAGNTRRQPTKKFACKAPALRISTRKEGPQPGTL